MAAPETIAALQARFPGRVGQGREFRGEWTVSVDRAIIRAAARWLKDEENFRFLVDISSVDHFGEEPRYEVVYEFCDLATQTHLRVKTRVSEDDPALDSLVPVFQGADWHEREIYDMMGLRFHGHPDLRRILMWEGYPYHPLRKDFPLAGLPSDLPDEAFTLPAPLDGGPFVARPGGPPPDKGEAVTTLHEPRARSTQT